MRSASIKTGAFAVALTLMTGMSACDGQLPAEPSDAPPPAPNPITPPVEVVTPVPQPDPAQEQCRFGFTANDANMGFTAMEGLDAGPCTLKGLRAHGSRLTAEWTVPGSDTHSVLVGTEGCDEGEAHGPFVLVSFSEELSKCTGLRASLTAAMAKGILPSPTNVREESGEETGPDGDGKHPPPGAKPTADSSMPAGMAAAEQKTPPDAKPAPSKQLPPAKTP